MSNPLSAQEIREKYLKSMESHGYKRIAPAPLVLNDDPTTLFTIGGMQPLVPNLLGQPHADGELLTNSQPCLRSQDLEEVGDNRHTTFFEMLGDWSLNGFDKEEQIRWLFDFLVKDLGLAPEKLYITCFIGDPEKGVPRDDETADIWQKIFAENGIEAKTAEIGTVKNGDARGMKPGERIFFYDDNENWWSRGGGIATTPVGDPAGPDNEIFYDFGEEAHDDSFGKPHPASDSGRFVEICNKVFMQYEKLPGGGVKLLDKGKIDFGGGLSRLASAVIGKPDIFLTSLYFPIIEKLEDLSGKDYASNQASMRVIADHLTAATWLAAQNLTPSNKEQGYVMRRLIRRAIRFAFDLGMEQNFLSELVPIIADIYTDAYSEIFANHEQIIAVLVKEEKAFRQTLRKGLKEFDKLTRNAQNSDDIAKPNFVILHGYKDGPESWFHPWLKSELENRGFSVQTPQLPNIENPDLNEQINFVLDNCDLDENTIFVGHSLGAAVAMKALEKLNHKIRGLILLAPSIEPEFWNDDYIIDQQTGEKHAFVKTIEKLSYNYEKIIAQADFRQILGARNDTPAREKYMKYLAGKIRAKLLMSNASEFHFMSKEDPFILENILKIVGQINDDNILTGAEIFTLYDTFGFPVELSVEEAYKRDLKVSQNWRAEFDDLMQKQREMSQTAAKGTFKGGLGGQTWQHRRYHTATHLLQSALREIFGGQLRQHGSNITEERLRFDFNLDRKMTPDEISKAEELVNKWIAADLPIFWREYGADEALKMGAIGPFGERYGDKVKVYQMGAENSGFATDKKLASLEICGGPHCERTGQLAMTTDPDDSTDSPQNKNNIPPTPRDQMTKKFRIAKEESTAAGIRRIKAILE